jgi:putative polyhydroxyalkanoate system protein
MSSIDIRQDHALSAEQARTAIEEAARKLDERFGLRSNWNGERLNFSGSGVDGAIELLPGQVRVTATLGFLLSAMQGMVESEIRRVLSEKLGTSA